MLKACPCSIRIGCAGQSIPPVSQPKYRSPTRQIYPISKQSSLVPEYLEVKIGQGHIKDKIVFLAGLILDANKDLSNIKYIDLRFKDVSIGPKD